MVREMCGIKLNDRKTSENVMLILGLNESIDQLAMANCAYWYGHVLKREDGHVLSRACNVEIEGQGREGGWRGHG